MNRSNIMTPTTQRDQHGQSAVEIALLLPVLLLLILGIIMASFIFYASIQVSNATREGARAGSVYRLTVGSTCTPTCMSLDTTVKNAIYYSSTLSALGNLNKASSNFSILCTLNGTPCSNQNPNQGDQIKVTLIYSYTVPVVSTMLPMFPQPIVFSPLVIMEVQ